MQKTLISLSVGLILFSSCGNNENDTAKAPVAENAALSSMVQQDVASSPQGIALKNLMSQSDCATCHQIETKSIGPAYTEVAKKYDNNEKTITYLAEKIIKGGSGVWGEVPMTDHPNMSQADAAALAKDIMSLKSL